MEREAAGGSTDDTIDRLSFRTDAAAMVLSVLIHNTLATYFHVVWHST